MIPALKDPPSLQDMLAAAVARYRDMSPDQKRKMWADQRRSWVVGEMLLSHPELTRYQVEAMCDEMGI